MAPPNNQACFAVQAKLKADLGLKRLPVEINPQYKKSGLKSYLHLLHKYSISPTKPGPYVVEAEPEIHQRGLAGGAHALGGRALMVTTHQLRKKDTATGQLGMIPSDDQQFDSMYLTPVQIGTPAQTLMLDFDTGSADLWVFSSELSPALQKGHKSFDSTKSSTYKAMPGYTWSITYGDRSSASGNCGSDTVGLGGLLVEGQTVELANKMSAQFQQSAGDGLLGLAFSSINTVAKNGRPAPQPTPVTNMIAQKDIPANAELFTSCFYSERDVGKESFYTFGYIDQSVVEASGQDIVWTDIDKSEGLWMFPSTTYTINGKQGTQAGNTAIADTGTTLALVSDAVVDPLYAAIPGAKYSSAEQGYIFPDTVTADQLPKFSLAVGETEFTIQPEDFVFAPSNTAGFVYGGIQSRGSNPFDILGDAFLKSIYAIWDQGNVRFGAVPKIQKVQNM